MAPECARAGVREERRVWKTKRQPRMRSAPQRLVFIDETSVTTKMARLRGRSRRGRRLRADAPFGHWGTQTFIAGLRCHELTAPWVIRPAAQPIRLRHLHRDPARADAAQRRHRHSRQSCCPQKSAGGRVSSTKRRLVPIPATLFAGSEPDRDGVLKAEGTSAQGCRQNIRRSLEGHRRYLRPL